MDTKPLFSPPSPPTLRTSANFETTKRLLAALINEQLVSATLLAENPTDPVQLKLQNNDNNNNNSNNSSSRHLLRLSNHGCGSAHTTDSVIVGISAHSALQNGKTIGYVHPEDMVLPVVLRREMTTTTTEGGSGMVQERRVSDPVVVFEFLELRSASETERSERLRWRVQTELRISAARQEMWFRWAQKQPRISFGSPLIEWERAVIRGHPLHPMHRSCLAQSPLLPLDPEELVSIIEPEMLFAYVPRNAVHITGPFEKELSQLLSKLHIEPATPDKMILPCLKLQAPAIQQVLGPKTISFSPTTLQVQAQTSSRSVSLPSSLEFPYHLKLSLNCTISATTRTMSAAARAGPQFSLLLEKVLSPELWVFKEIACVTGTQEDPNQAKQFGCILREDLELKARSMGQMLIPCTALTERGPEGGPCHAERVFELQSLEEKRAWLWQYTRSLFRVVLPPIVNHGIGLEAHSQNMVARFSIQDRRLLGFAIRDFGGMKLHMPTVRNLDPALASAPLDAYQAREEIQDVYQNVYAHLFNSHLAQFVHGLGLQNAGGWTVVREELGGVLGAMKDPGAVELHGFLLAERLPISCYIRTKLDPPIYGFVKVLAPNVMLS